MKMYAKFHFYPIYGFRDEDFFLIKIYVVPATNQIKRFRQSRMKCGELFNKHFCKKKTIIPNETAEIDDFHFSQNKALDTLSCHSNESTWTLAKETIIYVEGNVMSMYAKFQPHPSYGF